MSSNDPIYLTATYSQILEDVLEDVVGSYAYVYEGYDPETNWKLKQQELDPDFAEKEQDALAEDLLKFFGAINTQDEK